MTTFAFAPYEVFPLAVIAPTGLLVLWLRSSSSVKYTAWLGFLFGLGLFGAGVYWVYTSIHIFGDVPITLAVIITMGMIAILSAYPALVGYLLNRYFPINQSSKLLCAFPAIWVCSEWVRSWLFTGFPWLFLGYSQTNSPLKGFAPLLSVYGVSLALAMSSGLIVNAVIQYKRQAYRVFFFNLLALVLIWLAGGLLSLIHWTRPEGKPISVALVQGNIPQSLKWSSENLQLTLSRYSALSEPYWKKDTIIIWPEAAIPLPLQDAQEFINKMDEKAKKSGAALLLGIPIGKTDETGYFNAVISLGAQNKVYLKRHLVPFGEYTPLSNLFSGALQFMDIPMSNMLPGKLNQEPIVIGNIKILTSICYEIAFPELTRSFDKSINLLLVVTNDAWFGVSNAQAQHLQMAAMRAIEFGKPVLFVSNDGITAVINPYGQIAETLPKREAAVLTTKVQPMYGITPWLKNGSDPLFFILLCLLYVAVRKNRLASKTEKTTQANNVLSHSNLTV